MGRILKNRQKMNIFFHKIMSAYLSNLKILEEIIIFLFESLFFYLPIFLCRVIIQLTHFSRHVVSIINMPCLLFLAVCGFFSFCRGPLLFYKNYFAYYHKVVLKTLIIKKLTLKVKQLTKIYFSRG